MSKRAHESSDSGDGRKQRAARRIDGLLNVLNRDNIVHEIAGFAAPDLVLLNNALKAHAADPVFVENRNLLVSIWLWRNLNKEWHGVVADAQLNGAADASLKFKPMLADVLEYYIAHDMHEEFLALHMERADSEQFYHGPDSELEEDEVDEDINLAAHDIDRALFPAFRRAYTSNADVFSAARMRSNGDMLAGPLMSIGSLFDVDISVEGSYRETYLRLGTIPDKVLHRESLLESGLVASVIERDDDTMLARIFASAGQSKLACTLITQAFTTLDAPKCIQVAARYYLKPTLTRELAVRLLSVHTEAIFTENMDVCQAIGTRDMEVELPDYIPYVTDGNIAIIRALFPTQSDDRITRGFNGNMRQAMLLRLALVSCRVDLISTIGVQSLYTTDVLVGRMRAAISHYAVFANGSGHTSFARVREMIHYVTQHPNGNPIFANVWSVVFQNHPRFDFTLAEWEIFLTDPAYRMFFPTDHYPTLLRSLPLTSDYNGIALRLASGLYLDISDRTSAGRGLIVDTIYSLYARDCLAAHLASVEQRDVHRIITVFLTVATRDQDSKLIAKHYRFVDCILALLSYAGLAYVKIHTGIRQSLYLASNTADSRGLRRIIDAIEALHQQQKKQKKGE